MHQTLFLILINYFRNTLGVGPVGRLWRDVHMDQIERDLKTLNNKIEKPFEKQDRTRAVEKYDDA